MARGRTWSFYDTTISVPHTNAGSLGNLTGILANDIGSNPRDYSHLRTVGSITISAPAGSTAYDSAKVFLGITVVDGDAAAAGSFPDPYGDNVDWIWTHGCQVFVPDNPSATLSTPCIPDHLASPWIDIRQARRMRGDELLYIVGYDDSGISGALNISIDLRTLWQVRV